MKLFRRKTATFQDYVDFIGIVLFIWVIAAKKAMIGSVSEIFVMDNILVLVCTGVLLEMLLVNLSFFITDFKNFLYDKKNEKKYGKGKDNEKEN